MSENYLERDEDLVIRSPKDLEHAMFLIQWHYDQSRIRGEEIIMEIWSPKVSKTGMSLPIGKRQ